MGFFKRVRKKFKKLKKKVVKPLKKIKKFGRKTGLNRVFRGVKNVVGAAAKGVGGIAKNSKIGRLVGTVFKMGKGLVKGIAKKKSNSGSDETGGLDAVGNQVVTVGPPSLGGLQQQIKSDVTESELVEKNEKSEKTKQLLTIAGIGTAIAKILF